VPLALFSHPASAGLCCIWKAYEDVTRVEQLAAVPQNPPSSNCSAPYFWTSCGNPSSCINIFCSGTANLMGPVKLQGYNPSCIFDAQFYRDELDKMAGVDNVVCKSSPGVYFDNSTSATITFPKTASPPPVSSTSMSMLQTSTQTAPPTTAAIIGDSTVSSTKAVSVLPKVSFTARLPLNPSIFALQEAKYIIAIADTAGVDKSNVAVVGKAAVASRRDSDQSARRQSAAAGAILDVSTRVTVPEGKTASAIAGQLTLDAINTNLVKAGLPPATALPQSPVVESPAIIGSSSGSSAAAAGPVCRSGGSAAAAIATAIAAAAVAAALTGRGLPA
jgi:hypothetical protein